MKAIDQNVINKQSCHENKAETILNKVFFFEKLLLKLNYGWLCKFAMYRSSSSLLTSNTPNHLYKTLFYGKKDNSKVAVSCLNKVLFSKFKLNRVIST